MAGSGIVAGTCAGGVGNIAGFSFGTGLHCVMGATKRVTVGRSLLDAVRAGVV